MSISQTSVGYPSVTPRAGLRYDMRRTNDIISRAAPSGGIVPGRFVVGAASGTTGKPGVACAYPASSADVTEKGLGFALWDEWMEQAAAIPQYAEVPILRSGCMYVLTEDAVAYGKQVFIRFTVEAPDLLLGTVRSDADTDKAVALPDSKYLGSTSGAAVVLIEFAIC